ncbi:MAG TPA: SAM-dependent methyltransferase [Acidimicrobiales bacterium]|nr:SAM-dependent methyltransferase [Acidimicrobiales bacterium]
MARESVDPTTEVVEIDTSVAHAARIYDYMLGGTTNFTVDRETADHAAEALPGGFDGVRAGLQANRAFLGRAVDHLARDVGVRQFLDIGTGIPTEGNVHEVAQAIAPESRIVYVDNDPIVLAHARTLLTGTSAGETLYLHGDLRQPDDILRRAAEALDLDAPVAILLVAVLHFICDADDPAGIVRTLLDAVPAGSHLVLSHVASDERVSVAELDRGTERLNRRADETYVTRSRDTVRDFFAGLDLLDPGLVHVHDWRPAPDAGEGYAGWSLPVYGGVARKP